MGVGTFQQPDFESQGGTAYKTAIDNAVKVCSRIGASFAPHEQDTPNMTIRVDAGDLWVNGALVQKAAQNTGTITAPAVNPRIDRVVIDAQTGTVSVITGDEDASPDPPEITDGKLPVCQVALATSTTEITNDLITDERVAGASSGEAFAVNGIYSNLGEDPATELGYGTWSSLGNLYGVPSSLLLHFDGSGATFVDSSLFAHTITAYGGAAQSASQSKFGGKSLYCDGVGDYLTIPNHDCFKLGTVDFTIESWVRMDNVGTNNHIFYCFGSRGVDGFCLLWYPAGGVLIVYLSAPSYNFAWTPLADTWYHIAVCREGTNLRVFVNGVQIGSTQTSSNDVTSTGLLYIGREEVDIYYMKGYMDELCIKKGYAAYLRNFAPPAAPYYETCQWLRTA